MIGNVTKTLLIARGITNQLQKNYNSYYKLREILTQNKYTLSYNKGQHNFGTIDEIQTLFY